MILLALLASAAQVSASNPDGEDLAICLAHYSRTARYRAVASTELAEDREFIEGAKGNWCRNQAGPLWDRAHEEARAALGLTGTGPSTSRQQELAEAAVERMMDEAWIAAAAMRESPPPISEDISDQFLTAWTLSQFTPDGPVSAVFKPAIDCTAQTIRARSDKARLLAGMADSAEIPELVQLKSDCGLTAAAERLAVLAREDVPGRSNETYRSVADDMLGAMVFYSAIAEGKSR